MQYATALDVESIRLPNGLSVPFAIAWRKFGRDPHEYIGDRRKGTLVHSPMHRFEPKLYIINEFFENEEICDYVKKSNAWSRKILDFFMSSPKDVKRDTLENTLKDLTADVEGPLMAHCIHADLESIWNGDRIFKTGIFPNGPHFRSPVIKNWNSLTFVCTRKAFTDPNLNAKFLKKYPSLIDTSLEALTMAIRGTLDYRQTHLPQDDVDTLIDLLDHVYTHVSKQDFWNLLQLKHDHYDSIPVNVHQPGNIRFDTIQASDQCSLKN